MTTAAVPTLRLHTRPAPAPESWPSEAEAFLRSLDGPTWIDQPGRDPSRHRTVSTLLHGNEPSGTRAVLAWLRSGAMPAVDTSFFIASVEAALTPPVFGHRVLFGHSDLNRCFRAPYEGEEGRLAEAVLERVRKRSSEALVDLHNTTGDTPAYGVGPSDDPARLSLTAIFADRYVHSDLRLGALVEAVQDELPTVVVECGRAGSPEADEIARAGLERFLTADSLEPAEAVPMTVVGSPVRVCLQPGLVLRYGEGPDESADLVVDAAVDRHNFEPLGPGDSLGWVRSEGPWPFVATRADGAEVSRELLEVAAGRVRARRSFVPIMMTTDAEIAVQDCIFYAAQGR